MAQVVQYSKGLVRGLGAWQILFITIGGTIGLGFATTSGEVLAISGPGGVLIAFGVVGVVAICVMEGICEMIVLWPISNAMIEFVRAFVDPDLAIVVGVAYWYTYSVTLAALIIGSVNLLQYWELSFPLTNVVFAIFLLTVYAINSRGIKVFGWIELFGGILKVLLVLAIFIIMMLTNSGTIGNAGKIGSTFFNDSVRNNPNVATTHFKSVLVSIPLAIFSYIGVELVTVTAFEAKVSRDASSLGWPAQHIAYIMLAIYLISVGGFAANIEWFNQYLPLFFSQPHVSIDDPNLGHAPRSFPPSKHASAAPVIAVIQAGIPNLPGVLVGFLVYSGLSAANTGLYVASRTLYGLTRNLDPRDRRRVVRFFAKLNYISDSTSIPVWSLLVSWVVFACWLPFLHLKSNFTQKELQQTLVAIGSVGCVLVWASQCLAFIRYNKWLYMHQEHLVGDHLARFNRWNRGGFSSYASSIQPLPAYIGLISCIIIVFVLNSVSMYNGERLAFKALTIYLGPCILLILLIILKFWNRRWPVSLGEWPVLRNTLSSLDALIEAGRPPTPPQVSLENGNINNPHPFHPPPDSRNNRLAQPVNGQINGGPGRVSNSGYPNGTPAGPANPGFAMPPTPAQLAALRANAQNQNQSHGDPRHQISQQSLTADSRFGRGGNGDVEDNYELSEMGSQTVRSPASPVVSEVHSESMDISRMDLNARAREGHRTDSVVSGFSDGGLEPGGFRRHMGR